MKRIAPFIALALTACGGGSTGACATCQPAAPTQSAALATADVERIIGQAVSEAQARSAPATIAVTDRVGNVLAVFRMSGAAPTFAIRSGRGVSGGLENVDVLPSELAAVAKALTGAYLSSAGNAFTTRTASQIVQEHFNPRELGQPSGPLYGVQFSQLSCSDVVRHSAAGTIGPKRSPLGLAADPGGLPLYKDGTLVGGVGVIADAQYSLDIDIQNVDGDTDELIAIAAQSGFAPPVDRRGDRITADGRSFRYVDSEATISDPATAPPFAALNGSAGTLVAVPGYGGAPIVAGTAFGTPASGIRPDTGVFAGFGAHVLVDATDANRFAPRAGSDGLLTATEATQLVTSALTVAARTRAQIRRPLGSAAQVTVAVVDTNGEIVALARGADGPVFGIDVAVQKARSAAFFSNPNAATLLAGLAPALYPTPPAASPIGAYMDRARQFFADGGAFGNGIAFTTRALGNIARPAFPDGVDFGQPGPFSKTYAEWSPFTSGLQLDLVINKLVASLAAGDNGLNCTGLAQLPNGIQVFPGGSPIYRGNQLVGAIGVSGDGVDQDDLIGFLGVAEAARALGTGLNHAPAGRRADTLTPLGTRLRYVQCPQAPFIDSTQQNVCSGL
jgi:uncharacterized protein GlcG (DUF336 family)